MEDSKTMRENGVHEEDVRKSRRRVELFSCLNIIFLVFYFQFFFLSLSFSFFKFKRKKIENPKLKKKLGFD